MAETVVLAGVNYTIPDAGDLPGWGTGLTTYLVALAANIASQPTLIQLVNIAATPTGVVSGKTYLVTTASLAITLNLPTPVQNFWFDVKDVSTNAATRNITIHRFGTELIDGVAADKVLARSAGTWTIMSDGTNWYTINQFPDTGLVAADIAAGSITNAQINAAAAIAYSKLALTGAILNADLAGSIAYSKLALTGAILNADLAGSIAYGKLTLTGSVVNADIGAAAAIAVNKLAALSISFAVASDASGFLVSSTTTAAELAFVHGVTSAIQTQINTKYAVAGGALTGNLSFTTTSTQGIIGTITNDNAAAGNVGETMRSYAAAINLVTSDAYVDVASISLTAGDWDITAVVAMYGNGATTFTATRYGISSTSGNSATGLSEGDNQGISPVTSNTADHTFTIPNYRVSLSGTTTYYLKLRGTFTGTVPQSAGRISARRVR
jgi:hypothetical protein